MKIEMTKRKGGIYAQWYVVIGRNKVGNLVNYLIYQSQASTYAQAVRYWNEMWGKNNTAIVLRNAEPFNDEIIGC